MLCYCIQPQSQISWIRLDCCSKAEDLVLYWSVSASVHWNWQSWAGSQVPEDQSACCINKRRLQCGSKSHLLYHNTAFPSQHGNVGSGLASSGMALENQCSTEGVKHWLLAAFLMTWQVQARPCHVLLELLGMHVLICVHMAAVWPFVCFKVTFQPYCRWSTTYCCFVWKCAGFFCSSEPCVLKPASALLGLQLLVWFLLAFFG